MVNAAVEGFTGKHLGDLHAGQAFLRVSVQVGILARQELLGPALGVLEQENAQKQQRQAGQGVKRQERVDQQM
jgi:hypothetical protein